MLSPKLHDIFGCLFFDKLCSQVAMNSVLALTHISWKMAYVDDKSQSNSPRLSGVADVYSLGGEDSENVESTVNASSTFTSIKNDFFPPMGKTDIFTLDKDTWNHLR